MLSWEATPALAPMRCTRAWVEINLDALRHNILQLKSHLKPHVDLMSVVKADAYGHGAVTVAKTVIAAGATWLGVATVPEGIELREAGIEVPILMMGAVNDPAEIRAIARWQLQPALVNPQQALIFSKTLCDATAHTQTAPSKPLPVHLQLDTGMSRLGFNWQKPIEFAQFVRQLPQLHIAGIYSHLATADDPDATQMQRQHQRFESALQKLKAADLLPKRVHFANSAATLADPALHYDMVRVGLATYGLYPAPHFIPTQTQNAQLNSQNSEQQQNAQTTDMLLEQALRPVLEVKARLTHVKKIQAGDGVSYGHTFIAPRDMRIAIAGIGYADGVPRRLSNQLTCVLHGQSVAQIGAITMDQMMLDVSAVTNVQEGDVVTLLGATSTKILSADDWAKKVGTISWEILCGFKHRLPRVTVGNPPT